MLLDWCLSWKPNSAVARIGVDPCTYVLAPDRQTCTSPYEPPPGKFTYMWFHGRAEKGINLGRYVHMVCDGPPYCLHTHIANLCKCFLLPYSRPASARFQQTCISPAITESHMTDNQPNTRHPKLKPWKTKLIQVTSDPQFTLVCNSSRECLDQVTRNQTQGSPPTLTPNITSTLVRSTDIAPGKLKKLKNLLPCRRSDQMMASASMNISAFIQADPRPCSCWTLVYTIAAQANKHSGPGSRSGDCAWWDRCCQKRARYTRTFFTCYTRCRQPYWWDQQTSPTGGGATLKGGDASPTGEEFSTWRRGRKT